MLAGIKAGFRARARDSSPEQTGDGDVLLSPDAKRKDGNPERGPELPSREARRIS